MKHETWLIFFLKIGTGPLHHGLTGDARRPEAFCEAFALRLTTSRRTVF